MDNLLRVKEQLESIKILAGQVERHLNAGDVAKASYRAMDLEAASTRLFNMTYEQAYSNEGKHPVVNVVCLRCQPGGDLQATCTCGRIQHPRHERCGGQHAYGSCPLDKVK